MGGKENMRISKYDSKYNGHYVLIYGKKKHTDLVLKSLRERVPVIISNDMWNPIEGESLATKNLLEQNAKLVVCVIGNDDLDFYTGWWLRTEYLNNVLKFALCMVQENDDVIKISREFPLFREYFFNKLEDLAVFINKQFS